MGIIAVIAVAAVWQYHRREVRRLHADHRASVQEIGAEHKRRLERLDRAHDRQLEAAHHPLARDLLPALDSLDEALNHLNDDDQALSTHDLGEGLQLARQALHDALARHDVIPIAPEPSMPFNPEIHEAISRTETDELPPGTVSQLFRRGYRDGDRVLRAAMVEVAVDPDQSLEDSDGSSDELSESVDPSEPVAPSDAPVDEPGTTDRS